MAVGRAQTAPGTILAEPEMALPESWAPVFRLGTNAHDSQVSYVADLGEPGSLEPARFDVVILDRALIDVEPSTAAVNVFDSLRPDGILVASAPRSLHDALEAALEATFGALETARRGTRRVLVAQRGRR